MNNEPPAHAPGVEMKGETVNHIGVAISLFMRPTDWSIPLSHDDLVASHVSIAKDQVLLKRSTMILVAYFLCRESL